MIKSSSLPLEAKPLEARGEASPFNKKQQDVGQFACLFVPKDLANRWTHMVLLYRMASNMSWEGL